MKAILGLDLEDKVFTLDLGCCDIVSYIRDSRFIKTNVPVAIAKIIIAFLTLPSIIVERNIGEDPHWIFL